MTPQDMALYAAVIAYMLLLIETIYSYFLFLKKRTKQAYDRLVVSFAIFTIAVPLMFIDLVALARSFFGVHPQYFDPGLTLDFAIKAQYAANQTINTALAMSTMLALGQSIVQGAMWLATVVAGPISLVVGTAINVGIGTVKGVADVSLMIAQVLYAVGKLYQFFAYLAYIGKLLVPLGLALLVSKRTRPLGAVLTAIGIGLGYIIPFALNSVAYVIKGVTIDVPQLTGVPSVMCIHAVSGGPLVNGTWVRAGFPAVVEYKDLDRPNRTVVHPVGCYPELTGHYKVIQVFVGAEPISVGYDFTVKPLPPNVTSPFNTYDDMFLKKIRYPDLMALAELAGNNITIPLLRGPDPGDEDYYFAFWNPYDGSYAYIAARGFKLAPMNISTPWYTISNIVYQHTTGKVAEWYNYTYFPLGNPVMFADTWKDASKDLTYTKNMTFTRGNQTYTVTVNCTMTSVAAYGSVGDVSVVDNGEMDVNGTTQEPQVDIEMRSRYHWVPEVWQNFTRDTFNVWFNQSSRVFNNTFIDKTKVYVNLITNQSTIKRADVIAVQGPYTHVVQSYNNPAFVWAMAPRAPEVVVITTYCGRVIRPARVKMTINTAQFSSYPVTPENILLLNYDPLMEPFVNDTPLTINFKEEARNFLFGVYPFLFNAGLALTIAFLAMDAISSFLGGPSIVMKFILRNLQGAYWNIAIAKVGDIISLLAGGKIPSIPNVSAKYAPLIQRMNQQLKEIRQQMPLAVAKQKVKEAVKSGLAIHNLEEAEKRLRSVASGIKSALINKTLAALNLQIVERPILKSGDKPLIIERAIIKRTEKIRTALVSPDQKLSEVKMYSKVPVDPLTAKPIKVLYVGPPKLPSPERQLITTRLFNLAVAINNATYNRTPLLLARLFVGTMFDAVLSRNEHTIDAILGAAAHRLRTEASKISEKTGTYKTYHPVSYMLLKTANYLDMMRLLQNPYMIYSRTMFMLGVQVAYRPEKIDLSTKIAEPLLRFNTDKAYLATIMELSQKGLLDSKYRERAEALHNQYVEISQLMFKRDAPPVPEILEKYKGTFEEARKLIHEVVGSELAKAKVPTKLVNEIAELVHKRDLYIESLGTPSEKANFEAYKQFAEKIISELRKTDSEFLKRYANILEQDIRFIQDLYSEEKMQEFYRLADAYTRAMGTAIGQLAKVLGEHDPRFREIYTKHSGDPLQLSRAFDQLLQQMEVTDPGVTEPIKDFRNKLEDYIYLKVTGADKKELESAKEGLLLAYGATLVALGIRSELYKLDMEPIDRAADAFGDAIGNFFNQLSLMMQLAEAKTPEEAQRIQEEIAGFKATALVDLAISRLMSQEELEERAKSLPENAQRFINGAISALSGESYDTLSSNDERMGYIYVKTKISPEALSELHIPVRDWDSFLTGMQDAISLMANNEAPSMEEAKAKALEQPDYRDYWAGMYFAELLVYNGIDEAKLQMAELYGAEEKKHEAIMSEEMRKMEINEAQLETRLSSINSTVDEITKKLDDLAANLESQGIDPGLSLAMSQASKEAIENALESLYDLLAETKKEISAVNAMRPSLEYASEDLKDQANRLYNQLLSLEDSIKDSIMNLRNILSSMEEEK